MIARYVQGLTAGIPHVENDVRRWMEDGVDPGPRGRQRVFAFVLDVGQLISWLAETAGFTPATAQDPASGGLTLREVAKFMASKGVRMIAAERVRQVTHEGWEPEHDDEHEDGSLATVAALYALPDRAPWSGAIQIPMVDLLWPEDWDNEWWKPAALGDADDPRARVRELVKAGALIAAEIDRLQRAMEAPTA